MQGRLSGWQHAVAVFLLVVFAVMATTMVKREFRNVGSQQPDSLAPIPTYTREWHALRRIGVPLGDSAAPVQILEFVDFQCPVCRAQHDALKQVIAKFGSRVNVTLIHLPLSMHPFAGPAANAAECARRQGAFTAFVGALFSRQDSLGLRGWNSFARDAGVADTSAFAACVAQRGDATAVQAGKDAANRFRVFATPTTIINGWRFEGMLSSRRLTDVVQRLLAREAPHGVVGFLGSESAMALSTDSNSAPRVIYDSLTLRLAPQLRLAPVPIGIAGGGDDGKWDLSNLTQAVLLADGRIIALSRTGALVQVFAPDGQGERTIGRAGRGPKELAKVLSLARGPGDSLVFLDVVNRRVYWATPADGIVRVRPLEEGQLQQAVEMVAGVLPNDEIVLFGSERWPSSVPGDSVVPVSVAVAVLPEKGVSRLVSTILAGAFYGVETRYRGRVARHVEVVRFSAPAHVAVWDSLLVTASGEEYRLSVRGPAGQLLGEMELRLPRRAITAAMRSFAIASSIDRLRNGTEGSIDPVESERLIREARFADSLPAIEAVHVATDQTLWVVDAIAPEDKGWTATGFRLDGSLVGRLFASSPGVPMAFGKDRVVLRETDADGVVTLRSYRIVVR